METNFFTEVATKQNYPIYSYSYYYPAPLLYWYIPTYPIQQIPEKNNEEKKEVPKENNEINYSVVKKDSKKFFKCNFKGCNKLYKSKENLILHYRNKHLSQKPYQCDYCSVSFSHRNGKTYHERKVHTLVFPHKCSFPNCEMKFASKSALTYHLKHQH